MKKIVPLLSLIVFATIAFCQSNAVKIDSKYPYGPLPLRQLKETIGETYLLIPLGYGASNYESLQKAKVYDDSATPEHVVSGPDGLGKHLKLVSVSDEYANFVDENGVDYVTKLWNHDIKDMVLIGELDKARALFLNKILWLKKDVISAEPGPGRINNLRFEPVTVIAIKEGFDSAPIKFILQTSDGRQGHQYAVLSGTNTYAPSLGTIFTELFYTTDPKVTYHFTSITWEKIKSGKIEIGMTEDQLELTLGRPNTINNTHAGTSSINQWVYPNAYYYFTNGKLSSVQRY